MSRPGTYYALKRKWESTAAIKVKLGFRTELVDRPNGLKVVVRGPLVYALPVKASVQRVEYEKDGVERKFPYCDYVIRAESAWNYAFFRKPLNLCPERLDPIPFPRKRCLSG